MGLEANSREVSKLRLTGIFLLQAKQIHLFSLVPAVAHRPQKNTGIDIVVARLSGDLRTMVQSTFVDDDRSDGAATRASLSCARTRAARTRAIAHS